MDRKNKDYCQYVWLLQAILMVIGFFIALIRGDGAIEGTEVLSMAIGYAVGLLVLVVLSKLVARGEKATSRTVNWLNLLITYVVAFGVSLPLLLLSESAYSFGAFALLLLVVIIQLALNSNKRSAK